MLWTRDSAFDINHPKKLKLYLANVSIYSWQADGFMGFLLQENKKHWKWKLYGVFGKEVKLSHYFRVKNNAQFLFQKLYYFLFFYYRTFSILTIRISIKRSNMYHRICFQQFFCNFFVQYILKYFGTRRLKGCVCLFC